MAAKNQFTAARVLVVDDEPDILELLELALVRMGLEVERANNVREALQQLDSKPYNLLPHGYAAAGWRRPGSGALYCCTSRRLYRSR